MARIVKAERAVWVNLMFDFATFPSTDFPKEKEIIIPTGCFGYFKVNSETTVCFLRIIQIEQLHSFVSLVKQSFCYF